VPNERLRAALLDSSKYDATSLAEELGLDPKSVQRWVARGTTPHRSNAYKAARLLGVPASYLWPGIEAGRESASLSEIVSLYPHRSDVPRELWLDLLASAKERVWLYANASLFLPEDNPGSIEIIRRKAERGADVRILMANPDSQMCARRGIEEQLFEAIPARVRMALAYYAPLAGTPGIDFRLQSETLYNSIFTYDDAMLVNQHVYGMYGYMAPVLHLRRMPGGDFFDMYLRSFQRVWDVSSAIETSAFWRQREEAIRRNTQSQAGNKPASPVTAAITARVSARSGSTMCAPAERRSCTLSVPVATAITRAPPARPACTSLKVSPTTTVLALSYTCPYFCVARPCATGTRLARSSPSSP